MMTITRGLAVAAMLSGAAIGLASPAWADLTPGSYTATILDAGASGKKVGSPVTWSVTSCGPDCMHINAWDLHLQGNTWTGTNPGGGQVTLDNSSLVLTLHDPNQPDIVIGLTKNG